MNIDISKIISGSKNHIEISSTCKFSEEDIKNTQIISISEVEVNGSIKRILDDLFLSLQIKGEMYLPCAVTLKPVLYPFNIEFEENLYELYEEIGIFLKKSENTIDILPIIWENILMEIPIRVVSEEASGCTLSGEGWKVITDTKSKQNPELEKLKDLL